MLRRLRRNKEGSQIAEFGPAVIFFVLGILIPIFVLLYVFMGYACCWYLNFMSVRAAATVSKAATTAAIAAQQQAWSDAGFKAFACATVVSNDALRYNTDVDLDMAPTDPPNDMSPRQPVELDDFVKVTTVVSITPIVQLPFIGLSPWTYTFSMERPIEETDVESGP